MKNRQFINAAGYVAILYVIALQRVTDI